MKMYNSRKTDKKDETKCNHGKNPDMVNFFNTNKGELDDIKVEQDNMRSKSKESQPDVKQKTKGNNNHKELYDFFGD